VLRLPRADDYSIVGLRRVTLLAVVAALAALLVTASSAPAALPRGPITRITVLTKKSLRTGVTFTHYRAKVRGYSQAQEIYKVAWTIGNSHVSLASAPLGNYNAGNQTIDVHAMSSALGAPSSLVAAINGDYSAYTTPSAYHNSGMLVHDRMIYSFGYGGDAVAFLPGGNFRFAHPRAKAAKLKLGGGVYTTVGAINGLPGHSDQVGAYVTAGAKVTVPSRYAGYVVNSDFFSTMLTGSRTQANASALRTSETVVGFSFSEPEAAPTQVSLPIVAAAPAGTQVTIPPSGALLVAKVGGSAELGLTARAASADPVVNVNGDDQGWSGVTDVMGGKPMLVANGTPISRRPNSIDPWQWSCGGGCWRPALVHTTKGKGEFILIGQRGGMGLTMPAFAKVLKQLGAKNAIGFDNNGSAELYRPGSRPVTGYGYERWLPSATTLSYH
jgi:phosphodiester glycosidase